ncbi:hypothetical protein IE81DRAFT_341576 [Ceraceosorus guamensis]|uniref:Ubiquitin thioesterase OTU n=1 Tax=Ceraceosorus guamensis TaxID=1522189 RepID=A0A316W0L3_9BASI|nr:hypothetical protein IE81DRAFT_341576 [Ceraceosorus guamensis]PWN42263.1 hypothetical protein IE81DRAFT_341576 [Ceraceosorus guamensis]
MIRIRHPQGTSTLHLAQVKTLQDLQKSISESCGIPAWDQELRTGYPPRPLSVSTLSPGTLLSHADIALTAGSQLTVSYKPATSSTPNRSAHTIPDTTSSASSSQSAAAAAPIADRSFTAAPSTPLPQAFGNPASAAPPALKPKPPASSARFGGATTPRAESSRAPLSSSAYTGSPTAKKSAKVADGEVHVPLDGQALTLKVVDDDNSCLFNAVSMLVKGTIGAAVCKELRQIVSSVVLSSPDEYPEVILGHDPAVYAAKMLDPKTWGGAVELSILSKHFQTELHAADVASGVVHRFGEGMGFEERAWLLYSGIHYDAIALLPTPDAPLEFGTLRFPVPPVGVEDVVLEAVQDLVSVLKKRHYYTDTSTFALKCNRCQTPLQGQRQATEHAKQTGHTEFVENE